MQKKDSSSNEISFLEVKSKSKFWHPVNRGGWWIKFSTYRDSNILLLFVSEYTGQTIIRYYSDENSAVDFINFVVSFDPREYVPA